MSTTTLEAPAAAGTAERGAPPAKAGTNEFLTYRLGSEEYGMDILRVQEIRSYEEPTRIANAPGFIKGVMNLRGVIVPIVDMRLKLGLDEAPCDGFTVIIVLNLGARVVGMVVDSVSDVVTLAAEQMRPVPEFNAHVDSEHLLAIGAVDERMLILVDIAKMMASPELGLASFGTP